DLIFAARFLGRNNRRHQHAVARLQIIAHVARLVLKVAIVQIRKFTENLDPQTRQIVHVTRDFLAAQTLDDHFIFGILVESRGDGLIIEKVRSLLRNSRQERISVCMVGKLSISIFFAEHDMKITSFQKLYVHSLKDIFNAEKQIVKALPKMIKAATNPDLKT